MAKRAVQPATIPAVPAPDPLFNLHKVPLDVVVGSLENGMTREEKQSVVLGKQVGPLRPALTPSNR